jgi:long-chain acyl-CoA synthetase
MTNLAHALTNAVAANPDGLAVKLDQTEIPYRALDAASARVAGLLHGWGIGRGAAVGIMLPNVPYFPICYYGALRAGAAVVPMNVPLKEREVEFYLRDSEAKLLFAWHGCAEEAKAGADAAGVECLLVAPGEFEELLGKVESVVDVREVGDHDTAVILYTSGTTGTPKGAELTHANLRANAEIACELMSIDSDTVIFGGLPLFHSFGQTCGLNAAVAAGASLTLLPRFDPGKALQIIARDRVNVFQGVPTMYTALLGDAAADSTDTSSLRVCASGGAALPVDVLRGFEERFGCTLLEGYGLSETSPIASFNHPERARKPGSIGTPVHGVEMKIVDETGTELPDGERGEIVIRGHNVMKGYWKRPDATLEAIDEDGWFKTGDIGVVDEDGYFAVVDRKKDMIIRGGYNVYPREIEEVLYEHPDVREAAVVGLPHEELGEEVGAAVALKTGSEATPAELQAYVKERVAAYKYPRHVWLVDELPKGATGKILKRAIDRPARVTAGRVQ